MTLRNLSLIISILLVSKLCDGQQGEWVWISGSNTTGSFGNFGIQGVSNPSNVPPALYEPCEWTDLNGNFWMFGGQNPSGYFSCDLWKFDPLTSEWTWMKGTGVMNQYDPGYYGTLGVFSPSNYPPSISFGVPTWVDNQGDLWLYSDFNGGLWKYDIANNMWACIQKYLNVGPIFGIKGIPDSISNPGHGSERTTTWSDSTGNLFLFGGQVNNLGYSNTLWKFNTNSLKWTWLKGDSIGNQPSIYGILGLEDTLNMPGARLSYSHWKDNNGNVWFFGGGYNDVTFKVMNDLWRYNPATNNFTWMGGSNTVNSQGNFGIKCYATPSNIPPARFENRAVFTDSNGNFWMFGGGKGSQILTEVWNDLWMYDVSINQWIWISGDNFFNPPGNWGLKGISSPANKPNGRGGAVMWHDNNGHLYVFGGCTSSSITTSYNDLWKYTIDTVCLSTSINELNFQNKEIEVFPNPTSGELKIIIHKDNFYKAEYKLTDLHGKNVFASEEKDFMNSRTKTINIGNLTNGIYILEVLLDGKRFVRKVEKH